MRWLVMVIAMMLAGVVTAGGNAFNPVPEDSVFSYFMGKCGTAVERTAYYSLTVVDGVLTAQVQDTKGATALTHKISEQKKCPTGAELRQSDWPKAKTIRHVSVDAQPPVLAGLRGKAGVEALSNGWAVTHKSIGLNNAVAAYQTWFDGAGLTLTPVASTSANVMPFELTGLAADLRVVFHREGTAVRVYIGGR